MTKDKKHNLDWAGKSLGDIMFDERTQAIQEVRDSREKLGRFTLRFMMEAIYGEQYTKEVLGESGGNVLMRDIQVETTSENGGLRTRINEKQMRGILEDANQGRSEEDIKEGNVKAKKLMQDLSEFSPEEREAIMKFIKKMGEEE